MSLFCFTQPRSASGNSQTKDDADLDFVTSVRERAIFEAEMMAASRDSLLVIVCWTADWCLLNREAVSGFQMLAAKHHQSARFLLCDVDKMHDLAAEYAVHDLPSFHIFHNSSLVERLSGLRSLQFVPSHLDYHSNLSATSTSDCCTSPFWNLCSTSGATTDWLPKTPRESTPSTSSCDGSHLSCVSLPEFTSRETAVLKNRYSAASTATNVSERSYLPTYVRTRRNSHLSSHWRSNSWDCQQVGPLEAGRNLRYCISLGNR